MNEMTPADMAAVMKDNDGFGNGNGWWIILLFMMMGWGGGNWGNNVGGDVLYPWMTNQQTLFDLSTQLGQTAAATQLEIAGLRADIAREACACRQATQQAVQEVLNQMCQDKIDAKNDEIDRLRTQINVMNLNASQTAQTATILANNEAQTTALEKYLAPVPIPAYIVPNPNAPTTGTTTTAG